MEFYLHALGICTYMGIAPKGAEGLKALRRWISWHRRKGVSFFYLYAAFDTDALKREFAREIDSGLLLLLQVNGGNNEQKFLSAYRDSLQRARYVCKHVAFLKMGEYLQVAGQKLLPEILADQFSGSCAALYMQNDLGIRCIASPLAVSGFETETNLITYDNGNLVAKPAEGIDVSRKLPPRRIALLSHVMARNGAPLALLSVAGILREAGYEVDVFSVESGALEGEFRALGAGVIIAPEMHTTPLADQPWYPYYDLVVVNTAVLARCFDKPLQGAPAIWWLHESPSSLEWCGVDKELLANIHEERVTTFGVSPLAQKAFLALRPDWHIAGNLVLGVRDSYAPGQERRKNSGRFVFMMIGAIEKNKGQDIFLQAIAALPEDIRRKGEFWMVGSEGKGTEEDYCREIRKMAERYTEVQMIDFQPHEKILEMYGKVDVLVVPSREECLPTVVIEAMMMGVPCILTDKLGVSYYVTDEKNALLFENGSPGSLAERLHQVICDKAALSEIGRKGRLLYEKEFAMEIFRGKLLKAVQDCMGN